jgi:flavodoxin
MDSYDVVYIGYPNWWGTMPMAVYTFLDSYDFSGKTIVTYCTHEGSGLGSSERDIKKLCPTAKVLAGLAIKESLIKACNAYLISIGREECTDVQQAIYRVRNILFHQFRDIPPGHDVLLDSLCDEFTLFIVQLLSFYKSRKPDTE